MRCKKGQVVMTVTVKARSKDYKGKVLNGNAERFIEGLLQKVFTVYVKNFGKKLSINYPDIVEVIPDGE